MSNPDESTESNGPLDGLNRRSILQGMGTIGLGSTVSAGTVAAQVGGNGRGRGNGGRNGERNGNGRGSDRPPEKCTCPDGTLLAKYDFVDDGDGCRFELTEGEDVIDITDWDGKGGDKCEPVTLTYEADGYRIIELCAFGGTDTDTDNQEPDGEGVYTFDSNLTTPGGQRAAISNVTFCGTESEEETECVDLTVEYECTTYRPEESAGVIINWRRQGTRFRVFNNSDAATEFGWVITNDVNTFGALGSRSVDGGARRILSSDSSVPRRAIVFWEGSEACAEPLDLETWGEFKRRNGFDTLDDFYDGDKPDTAPEALDDSLYVVGAENIPNGSKPDEDISAEQYPDMSEAAEDAGWITCGK